MSAPRGWDEFDVIGRLLRPLARDAPEALGLLDDAALLNPPAGQSLVVTTDTIVEGVHFLFDDPPDLIARKLLRVNLSDLAAKRARPWGYFLNTTWPQDMEPTYAQAFARGLAQDQAEFGLKLFGGDTTSSKGPVILSATLVGLVEQGGMLHRSGARAGDLLQVSGTIGDGALGLEALQSDDPRLADLIERYRLPRPRFDLFQALAGAHACADVSDGLIADSGHLAEASGLAITIALDRIPLSGTASEWAGEGVQGLIELATAGDDYELVCAAPKPLLGFSVIGAFETGQGIRVTYEDKPVELSRTGYRHGKDG